MTETETEMTVAEILRKSSAAGSSEIVFRLAARSRWLDYLINGKASDLTLDRVTSSDLLDAVESLTELESLGRILARAYGDNIPAELRVLLKLPQAWARLRQSGEVEVEARLV